MNADTLKKKLQKQNPLTMSPMAFALAACGGGGGSGGGSTGTGGATASLYTGSYDIPDNFGLLEYYDDGTINILRSDQSKAVSYRYGDNANPNASSVTLSGNSFIDGLLIPGANSNSGTKWGANSNGKTVISFSFIGPNSKLDATDYLSAAGSEGVKVYNNAIEELTIYEKGFIKGALQEWSAVANIEFVEVSEVGDDVGTLRFGGTTAEFQADSAGILLGWTWFGPTETNFPRAADIWLTPATMNSTLSKLFGNQSGTGLDWAPGTFEYTTLIHEIGHALGLDHPDDGFLFPTAYDSSKYTIMSYNQLRNDFIEYSPMVYDIQAIQHLYGANNSTNVGNTKYIFDNNTASTAIRPMLDTIWDAGGVDLLDMSRLINSCDINLNDGTYTKVGYNSYGFENDYYLGIAKGTFIENAIGGTNADRIIGNEFSNQIDGGGGNDLIYGGQGSDIFICSSGTGVDTIKDFNVSEDLVAFLRSDGSYTDEYNSSANAEGDLVVSLIDGSGSLVLENIAYGTELLIA